MGTALGTAGTPQPIRHQAAASRPRGLCLSFTAVRAIGMKASSVPPGDPQLRYLYLAEFSGVALYG